MTEPVRLRAESDGTWTLVGERYSTGGMDTEAMARTYAKTNCLDIIEAQQGDRSMAKDEEKEEGPRSFARVLEQLGSGDALPDINESFHELLVALRTQAMAQQSDVKGKFVLGLGITVDEKGVVGIVYDVKVTEPKPRRPGSVFWITRGGNLTVENPRQVKLPLVDVKAPQGKPVDATAASGAAE